MLTRRAILAASACLLVPRGAVGMTVTNPVRVFRVTLNGSEEIATSAPSGADNLPGTNVVAPGTYNVFGRSITMTQPGLYRISNYVGQSAQRIVYGGDLDALLCGIANNHQHGDADSGWNYASIALTRNFSTTCGGVAQMAVSIFQSVGMLARSVSGITTAVLNSYDNGHTINEVLIGGEWCAVDFDTKHDFWIMDGGIQRRASLIDIHDNLDTGLIIVRSLSRDKATDNNFGGSIRYVWLVDHTAQTENLIAWYQRVLRMPYIGNDIYCDDAFEQGRATDFSPSLNQMSRTEFLDRYYGYRSSPASNFASGWGAQYTVFDRFLLIPCSTPLTTASISLTAAHTGIVLRVARENPNGSYDLVWDSVPFNHPGGGHFDVAPGYTTPNDGAVYRLGVTATLPASPGEQFALGSYSRAQMAGNPSGNGVSIPLRNDGTICVRWS